MESKIILPYRLLLASAPALESLCLAAFPRVVRLVAEHALSGKDFFSVKPFSSLFSQRIMLVYAVANTPIFI